MMTRSPLTPEIEEIELRFHQAGLVPPADRRQGTYANAERLLSMLHWLRPPRHASAEPSNIFSPAKE